MNKQLGVVCIKVVFDVRVHSNNLLKGVVYKEDSRGPKTEPCGTPISNSRNSERVDPIIIAWN